ncbi:MAG: hypothetical protein AB2556_11845 [Candidatus Thiodiazotropha sp.]
MNFEGIDNPTPVSQILTVERQNNLAINIFGWDKGITVHRLSKQPRQIPRINLLLIEKTGKFHYTWIKNLNRLLYDQSKYKERKPECQGIGQTAARVEMPEEGKNKLTFRNHHKQQPTPFVICADFLSQARLKDRSSTPQKATPDEHSSLRLAATAISWCGVMEQQSRPSSIAVQMQQSTS